MLVKLLSIKNDPLEDITVCKEDTVDTNVISFLNSINFFKVKFLMMQIFSFFIAIDIIQMFCSVGFINDAVGSYF